MFGYPHLTLKEGSLNLKQLFPVWYTDEVIKQLKEERDPPPGLSDKLLKFTGPVHCTQHRVIKPGLEKTGCKTAVSRKDKPLCVYKRTWVFGGCFFFLLFVLFMISNFIRMGKSYCFKNT